MCHRSWVHGLAQTLRGPHRERGLLQTSDSSDEDVTPRLPPFRGGRLTAGGLAPKEADGSAHLSPGRSCRVRCIARVADAHSLVGIWCTTIGRAAAKSTLGSFVLSVRCVSVPRHAGRARREMDGRSAAGEGVYPLSRLGARTVPDSRARRRQWPHHRCSRGARGRCPAPERSEEALANPEDTRDSSPLL